MNEAQAAEMLEGIINWDRAIVIFPNPDGHPTVRFFNIAAADAAMLMYRMADLTIASRIPVDKPNAPKGPTR